jgi:peptidylprolyl isomerase
MTVKDGHTVAVHYTGKLDSGHVFDSSEGRDPLEFKVGEGQVIPGFEEAVRGLAPGEAKEVRLEPDQAYGEKREDLVLDLDKSLFEGGNIQEGQEVALQDQAGNQFRGTVVKFNDEQVTVDLNHPLAGQALNFELKVVDVKE